MLANVNLAQQHCNQDYRIILHFNSSWTHSIMLHWQQQEIQKRPGLS